MTMTGLVKHRQKKGKTPDRGFSLRPRTSAVVLIGPLFLACATYAPFDGMSTQERVLYRQLQAVQDKASAEAPDRVPQRKGYRDCNCEKHAAIASLELYHLGIPYKRWRGFNHGVCHTSVLVMIGKEEYVLDGCLAFVVKRTDAGY